MAKEEARQQAWELVNQFVIACNEIEENALSSNQMQKATLLVDWVADELERLQEQIDALKAYFIAEGGYDLAVAMGRCALAGMDPYGSTSVDGAPMQKTWTHFLPGGRLVGTSAPTDQS